VFARDLCTAHYQQWYAHGDRDAKCTVEGCDRNTHARGLCEKHLKRFYRWQKQETENVGK